MTDLTIEELKKREKRFQALYNKWVMYNRPSKKFIKQYIKVKHRFEYYAGKVAALCENELIKHLGEGKYYVAQTKYEDPVMLTMFNDNAQYNIIIECSLDQVEKGLFNVVKDTTYSQSDLITLVPKDIGEIFLAEI